MMAAAGAAADGREVIMFCPRCRAEYREGFTQCADCLVPLVERLDEPDEAAPAPSSDLELTTVLKSGNPALLALAKSLLESAEIPFLVRGEGIQDIVGWGRFPGGANLVTGLVELQVSAEDLEQAKILLEDLEESQGQAPDQAGQETPEP
jgi:hypothetical protein